MKKKNNNGKKHKSNKKEFQPESIPESLGQTARTKIEANSYNSKTQANPSSSAYFQENKWNWDRFLNRCGQVANIILAIVAIWVVKYSIESAEAATKSVRDNAENFKLQNTPYLQVGDFKFINDTLTYSLYNLNQYPAKIKKGTFGAWTKMIGDQIIILTTDEEKNYKRLYDPSALNVYVIKESPVKRIYTEYFPIHALIKNDLRDTAYFFGEIEYTDEVTNAPRKYEFIVRLYGTPTNLFAEFKKNNNVGNP